MQPGGLSRRAPEQQPFFYPPHHTTAPPPPFLRRSAMTHVHVHSMHTHRLQQQEYTYCSPSVRRHRPLHSGAEWQSHKKSSTNWSRPPLRFVFRSRSFFPGFVRPSVRSSAATQQPQNELHKVRIEVRNPIKMLQPYFLFLWKRG